MAVQPNQDSNESVPVWFHRYAIENERQHAAMNERITQVETRLAQVETRLVRWVVGSAGVAAAIIVAFSQLLDS